MVNTRMLHTELATTSRTPICNHTAGVAKQLQNLLAARWSRSYLSWQHQHALVPMQSEHVVNIVAWLQYFSDCHLACYVFLLGSAVDRPRHPDREPKTGTVAYVSIGRPRRLRSKTRTGVDKMAP